jgi:hypothetical protein
MNGSSYIRAEPATKPISNEPLELVLSVGLPELSGLPLGCSVDPPELSFVVPLPVDPLEVPIDVPASPDDPLRAADPPVPLADPPVSREPKLPALEGNCDLDPADGLEAGG